MKLAALALLFVAACDPVSTPHEVSIYALTPAPPGRRAVITEKDSYLRTERAIVLTRGVALATRCWDTCDYTCREAEVVSADSTTVVVRSVVRQGQTPDTEFALLAVQPGTTTVTVRSACGVKDYPVTVE